MGTQPGRKTKLGFYQLSFFFPHFPICHRRLGSQTSFQLIYLACIIMTLRCILDANSFELGLPLLKRTQDIFLCAGTYIRER